jgi:hypothetical protein
LYTVLALLAVVFVLSELTARTSIAQTVRAALVRNVDEPGLAPFSHNFVISQTVCGCTNCCFPETAPVPAGKRLVIQNVSGFFPVISTANMGPVNLQERDGSTVQQIAVLPVTFRQMWNGANFSAFEFNHKVQIYVDAGKTCRLSVFASGSWDNTSQGQVIISGYMVNLN